MQIIQGSPIYETRSFSTLPEMIRQSVALYGPNMAYGFRRYSAGPVLQRSYDELYEDVQALACTFPDPQEEGREIRMALIGDNSYEWMVTYLAILEAGCQAVPLDKQLPPEEVQNLLERSEAEYFFFSPKYSEAVADMSKELSQLKHRILWDSQGKGKERNEAHESYQQRLLEGQHLLRTGGKKRLEARKIDPDAMAILLFTSGTTSQSKGVMLSNRNLCSNLQSILAWVQLQPGERILSILPMHHCFENTVGQLFALSMGASIYIADGLRYLAKNLNEWKINVMLGVPLLYENIYRRMKEGIEKSGKSSLVEWMKPVGRGVKHLSVKAHRRLFSSVLRSLGGEIRLMVSGAAALSPEVIQGFMDFGIDFLQGYGMTEHAPVVSVGSRKYNSIGSVGTVMPGIELAIDTEENYRGAIGEILVRSDSVMLGYYKNEEATREVIDAEGWLHTGDMGYLDNKDCLFITGRCKSMIVLENGKKIFPEELEEKLDRLPFLKGSFVWGNTEEGREREVDLSALLEVNPEALRQMVEAEGEEEVILLLRRWEEGTKLPASVETFLQGKIQKEVARICEGMPSFKRIKYILYTFEPLQRTTTQKVRRPLQQERIRAFLSAEGKSLRQLHLQALR